MIDKRQIRNFDFTLLLVSVLLAVYGLIVIYSSTHFLEDPFHYVRRQGMWLLFGLGGIFVIILFHYVNFYYWAKYFYALVVLMLILVLFIGRGAQEATEALRWIDLGFVDIQPSEYAKPVLVLMLAKFFSDREKQMESFFDLVPAFIYTGILLGLIFMQPDLGTSLVFAAILLGILYMAGVKLQHLGLVIGVGLACIPVLWYLLEGYQRMRLIVFLNPELDPMGAGYQLMQSIIAVGSGGQWGQGLLEGTQAQGGFLPEQHTDFIFSVLGEEMGFAGVVVLIILFFVLVYRILWIGAQAKDKFGAYICSGVAVMLIFQVIVNIGMTVGVMPVTGLPLPFMSYGGNALFANFLSIGLVLNVSMRRHKIQF